jgi:hypothetical protein
MSYLTVDITTASDGPFQLSALFAIGGGTIAGATVTPSSPATPPRIVKELIIQADPGNSTNFAYVGTDATLLPTSGGGIGNSLAAGDPLILHDVALAGVYLSASANGVKINVIANGGFQ